MITVILNNSWVEFIIRRYDTNSFDEAVELLVDDWADGKVKWDTEETAAAFTPEWMAKNGYADDNFDPSIDRKNEIVKVGWFWWNGEDELIVEGRLIKSAPIEESDWPTMGFEGSCFVG